MRFEYYVLNWDWNRKKVIPYNVFNNWHVQEASEKAIRKYLRAPGKYTYKDMDGNIIHGFDGLCETIRKTIMWQEWARCEYEIAVGDIFTPELREIIADAKKFEGDSLNDFIQELESKNNRTSNLAKWDCYGQCEKNIPMITREIIYQYKEQLKEQKNEH